MEAFLPIHEVPFPNHCYFSDFHTQLLMFFKKVCILNANGVEHMSSMTLNSFENL